MNEYPIQEMILVYVKYNSKEEVILKERERNKDHRFP